MYQLIKTPDNGIWFSSHKGIFRYDTQTNTFRRFGLQQGLVGEEFNAFAATKLTDGRLVYGSMSGVTIFSPNQKTLVETEPKLITGMTVNNQPMSVNPFKISLCL